VDSRQAAAGCLEFGCRTNSWLLGNRVSVSGQSDITSIHSEHSYPPSVSNSPGSSTHTLIPLPQSQITKFVLKPALQNPGSSLIWRTLSRFQHVLSFAVLPAEVDTNEVHGHGDEFGLNQLVSFKESSPSSFATSSGTIGINESLAAQMGVEKSFWITIALAYWEFLNERESYLASAEG